MKAMIGTMVSVIVLAAQMAGANGGPFVVKYPGGDPAAKGVLARLDASLRPAMEERLKVLYENLSIEFGTDKFPRGNGNSDPLATVTAEYRIANPADKEVEVDFGFPILRGIYISPLSMMPAPAVEVALDGQHVQSTVISTSAIYGLIRAQARAAIDAGIAADVRLAGLMSDLRSAPDSGTGTAAAAVVKHLRDTSRWNDREAALMANYGLVNMGTNSPVLGGHWAWRERDPGLRAVQGDNMGNLAAVGEQKATQFLALLAGKFDSAAVADYEAIFKAWGGDVRERSVDLERGTVRPREVSLEAQPANAVLAWRSTTDPTVYARVDYLDPRVKLSARESAALKDILKNLPVTFTFAPMNLLHYRATFKPRSEQTVTVRYAQYAYLDTASPESYQLSYVIHPASLWKEFGTINLKIKAPEGVKPAVSVPCKKKTTAKENIGGREVEMACYEGVVAGKTGELFVGISKQEWLAATTGPRKDVNPEQQARAGR